MNDNRKIAILNQHDVIVTNIDGKDYAEDKYTQDGRLFSNWVPLADITNVYVFLNY